MIVKGGKVAGTNAARANLAAHLVKDHGEHGERQVATVSLDHFRNVSGDGISDLDRIQTALEEQADGLLGTKCKNPSWQMILAPDRELTPAEWEVALDILDDGMGFKKGEHEHQRLAVFHHKDGEPGHAHIIYGRRTESGTAWSDSMDYLRNECVQARLAAAGFGEFVAVKGAHTKTVVRMLREQGHHAVADMVAERQQERVATTATMTRAEHQQEIRTGVSKHAIEAVIHRAWEATKGDGIAFKRQIEEAGLLLTVGRKGQMVVVHPLGGDSGSVHEVYRAIFTHRKDRKLDALDGEALKAEIDARLAPLVDSLRGTDDVQIGIKADRGLPPTPDKDFRPDPPQVPVGPAREPKSQRPGKVKTVLEELAAKSASWTDKELRAACRRASGGSREKADTLYRNALRDEKMVTISNYKGERRYATETMVRAESRLRNLAREARSDITHRIPPEAIEAGITKWTKEWQDREKHTYTLSAEQLDMVRHVLSGGAIANVSGIAGAGKTTAIGCAVAILQDHGYKVVGCAPSSKAASGLQEVGVADTDSIFSLIRRMDVARVARSGLVGSLDTVHLIQGPPGSEPVETTARASLMRKAEYALANANTRTPAGKKDAIRAQEKIDVLRGNKKMSPRVKSWIQRTLERDAAPPVDNKTIVIADESGMSDTVQLSELIGRIRNEGGKAIPVGDAIQLQPVAAGAGFRVLCEMAAPAKLTGVNRQKEQWQREATQSFSLGTVEGGRAAMAAYVQHGLVKTGIGGPFDVEIIQQVETQIGTTLSQDDQRRVVLIGKYLEARETAGAIWHNELRDLGTERMQGHPAYPAFKQAQADRAQAALSIATDPEAVKWLARFGVDRITFAEDHLAALGRVRAVAQAGAAAEADRLAIPAGLEPGHGAIKVDFRHEAIKAMVAEWARDEAVEWERWGRKGGREPSSLMLAYTRASVADLNAAAYAVAKQTGRVSGPCYNIETAEHGLVEVGKGCRLQLFKNQNGSDLKNGTFATVLDIKPGTDGGGAVLEVRLDSGKIVDIDPTKYNQLSHGYASTIHKSQGCTVDRGYLVASRNLDLHKYYVALSRHRQFCKTYAAKGDYATDGELVTAAGVAQSADTLMAAEVDARRLIQESGKIGLETAVARATAILHQETENDHGKTTEQEKGAQRAANRDRDSREFESSLGAVRRLSEAASLVQVCHLPKGDLVPPTGRQGTGAERVLREIPDDRLDEQIAAGAGRHLQRDAGELTPAQAPAPEVPGMAVGAQNPDKNNQVLKSAIVTDLKESPEKSEAVQEVAKQDQPKAVEPKAVESPAPTASLSTRQQKIAREIEIAENIAVGGYSEMVTKTNLATAARLREENPDVAAQVAPNPKLAELKVENEPVSTKGREKAAESPAQTPVQATSPRNLISRITAEEGGTERINAGISAAKAVREYREAVQARLAAKGDDIATTWETLEAKAGFVMRDPKAAAKLDPKEVEQATQQADRLQTDQERKRAWEAHNDWTREEHHNRSTAPTIQTDASERKYATWAARAAAVIDQGIEIPPNRKGTFQVAARDHHAATLLVKTAAAAKKVYGMADESAKPAAKQNYYSALEDAATHRCGRFRLGDPQHKELFADLQTIREEQKQQRTNPYAKGFGDGMALTKGGMER